MDIYLDNRDGFVWKLSGKDMGNEENSTGIISQISWTTERLGAPGTLDMTLIKRGIYQNKKFKINPGDIIRVTDGKHKIFYGYVFSIDQSETEEVSITAYDQLRYLKNKDSYVFKGAKLGDVVKRIATDFQLKTGTLVDTRYTIPAMVEDNSTLIDIITKAMSFTISATQTIFVLYDDFGKLTLQSAASMAVDFSIGDDSLMTAYKYKRTIDQETYNYFKLVRDNKKTGKRDVYIGKNTPNLAKWGKLQYFDVVDEKLNAAQINAKISQLSALYGREGKSFDVDCMGDWRVRAGCYIPVFIAELNIRKNHLVERCTHSYEGNQHTMSLELRVF